MRGILALAAVGALALAGCIQTRGSEAVGAPGGHRHGRDCGHVFTNGTWVAIEVGALAIKDKPRK
jgi:hypothetical protein